MDETNRLADYISELKMLLNWKDTDQKEIWRRKPGRMPERSKAPDSRHPSVEKTGTRVCAWVRIPLPSENVLNTTRQSLQLTNSVILQRQFKMTAQSKILQKTRNVIRGWQPSGLKCIKKKIPSKDMWNTKLHVGLNESLSKWMTQTV